MKIIALPLAALAALAPAAAPAAVTPALEAAICGARSSCKLAQTYNAGTSPAGFALRIVEVRLGIKDKPDDAPESGCRGENEPDGGVEYWLLDGAAPPRRVLKLCNDGYGAAGVGDDTVSVSPNRLVHTQVGGSAWRWESTVTFALSPWRAIAERDCNFNVLSPKTGTLIDLDYLGMQARSIAKDRGSEESKEIGCPDWPAAASRHFTPQPAKGLLAGYDIVAPNLGPNTPAALPPRGSAIGDCVPAMTTGGVNGFIVSGEPAPAGRAAEIRVIEQSNSLLVQVFDPEAAAHNAAAGERSFVQVWIGKNERSRTRPAAADLLRIAVDLDGMVRADDADKAAAPVVERWLAHDVGGRTAVVLRLTWHSDTEFLYGAAIAYSQAEAGKRARMVATTGFAENRPLYLPDVISLEDGDVEPPPGSCRLIGGRLSKAD